MSRPPQAVPGCIAVARSIPTRRGWVDRWLNGMRSAWLRHLITIGEQRQQQLVREIQLNDADLECLRVQLGLLEL